HSAILACRAVDRYEIRCPQADVGIIGDNVQFLALWPQHFHRLADSDTAIEAREVAPETNHAVTADRREDCFTWIALAEMDNTIVIADNFYISIIIFVVKGEQFTNGMGTQRVEVPRPQSGKPSREEVEQQASELPQQ